MCKVYFSEGDEKEERNIERHMKLIGLDFCVGKNIWTLSPVTVQEAIPMEDFACAGTGKQTWLPQPRPADRSEAPHVSGVRFMGSLGLN